MLNIDYIFNPHTDVENDTLRPEALVTLINSVWTLLQHHKCTKEKADRLTEQNHILEQSNKNVSVSIQH